MAYKKLSKHKFLDKEDRKDAAILISCLRRQRVYIRVDHKSYEYAFIHISCIYYSKIRVVPAHLTRLILGGADDELFSDKMNLTDMVEYGASDISISEQVQKNMIAVLMGGSEKSYKKYRHKFLIDPYIPEHF